jgi:hypothetical protein
MGMWSTLGEFTAEKSSRRLVERAPEGVGRLWERGDSLRVVERP